MSQSCCCCKAAIHPSCSYFFVVLLLLSREKNGQCSACCWSDVTLMASCVCTHSFTLLFSSDVVGRPLIDRLINLEQECRPLEPDSPDCECGRSCYCLSCLVAYSGAVQDCLFRQTLSVCVVSLGLNFFVATLVYTYVYPFLLPTKAFDFCVVFLS